MITTLLDLATLDLNITSEQVDYQYKELAYFKSPIQPEKLILDYTEKFFIFDDFCVSLND